MIGFGTLERVGKVAGRVCVSDGYAVAGIIVGRWRLRGMI
jgi:hypothetical protein